MSQEEFRRPSDSFRSMDMIPPTLSQFAFRGKLLTYYFSFLSKPLFLGPIANVMNTSDQYRDEQSPFSPRISVPTILPFGNQLHPSYYTPHHVVHHNPILQHNVVNNQNYIPMHEVYMPESLSSISVSTKRSRDEFTDFLENLKSFKRQKDHEDVSEESIVSIEESEESEESERNLEEVAFNVHNGYRNLRLLEIPRREMMKCEIEGYHEYKDNGSSKDNYLMVRNKLIAAFPKRRVMSFYQIVRSIKRKETLSKEFISTLERIWCILEKNFYIAPTDSISIHKPLLFDINNAIESSDRPFENYIQYEFPLSHKHARIIVIGAGVSGLAAAKKLSDSGFKNVKILESGSRIGGRVYSLDIDQNILEMGASVIQGDRNPIAQIAKQLKLTLNPLDKHFASGDLNNSLECLSAYYNIGNSHNVRDKKFIIREGYGRVVEYLSQGLDIRKGCKVESINYGRSEEPLEIRFFTAYGQLEVIHADAVIVTVSLGVLKENSISFNPPLPEKKIESIRNTGFGVWNKIHLTFPYPFWHDKNKHGDISFKKNKKHFVLVGSENSLGRPALTVHVSGKNGCDFEDLSDEEIVNYIVNILKSKYGGSIPKPIRTYITRWNKNPNIKGSYSFNELSSRNRDYKNIAEPVGNVIFFAGEHCNPVQPSVVLGAYESGEKAAENMIAMLKSKWKTLFEDKETSSNGHKHSINDKITQYFAKIFSMTVEDIEKGKEMQSVKVPSIKKNPPEKLKNIVISI